MTRIAHVSDLHLVEHAHRRRTGSDRARLSFLSFGRAINCFERMARAVFTLKSAASRADHVVVTGDLTEDGVAGQFEALAEVIDLAGIAPEQLTVVPGNHDAYERADGVYASLAGPLKSLSATSGPGAYTVLDRTVLLPLSTAVHQTIARSSGRMDGASLERVAWFAEATRRSGHALIVAQHHPALGCANSAWNHWDGLHEYHRLRDVLVEYDHVHVLHGHTHRRADRAVVPGRHAQVFCAESVVEGDAPVRYYDVADGVVTPVTESQVCRVADAQSSAT